MTRNDFESQSFNLEGSEILYDPCNDSRVDSLPVLLASKQLYADTIAAIRRAPRAYVLDLLMLDEHDVWPTWLLAPCLVDRVETVRADIRMIGGCQE